MVSYGNALYSTLLSRLADSLITVTQVIILSFRGGDKISLLGTNFILDFMASLKVFKGKITILRFYLYFWEF